MVIGSNVHETKCIGMKTHSVHSLKRRRGSSQRMLLRWWSESEVEINAMVPTVRFAMSDGRDAGVQR